MTFKPDCTSFWPYIEEINIFNRSLNSIFCIAQFIEASRATQQALRQNQDGELVVAGGLKIYLLTTLRVLTSPATTSKRANVPLQRARTRIYCSLWRWLTFEIPSARFDLLIPNSFTASLLVVQIQSSTKYLPVPIYSKRFILRIHYFLGHPSPTLPLEKQPSSSLPFPYSKRNL